MRAAAINSFGSTDQIKIMDLPIPQPQPHEVQIKVAFAGVNPVDWKICEGLFKDRMPYEFPIILGWDVAGTISEIGSEVTQFKVGDEIYAYVRSSTIKNGSFAEFICFEAQHVSLTPAKITLKESAAIPLAGLTAWQSLFEAAQLKENESILILGGAGGVGGMAIQFAKHMGAQVITTASLAKHPYVRDLGAEHPIDYTQEDVVARTLELVPGGVDVVFDCVGNQELENGFKTLKPGGRIVSIVQPIGEKESLKYNVQAKYVFVRPDGEQLRIIGELLSEGSVIPPHIEVMPLENVHDALAKLKTKHVQGKIVLSIDGE